MGAEYGYNCRVAESFYSGPLTGDYCDLER